MAGDKISRVAAIGTDTIGARRKPPPITKKFNADHTSLGGFGDRHIRCAEKERVSSHV